MAVTHAGLKTGLNIATGIAIDAGVVALAASAGVTVPVIVAVAVGIVAGNLISAGFDKVWNTFTKKKKGKRKK